MHQKVAWCGLIALPSAMGDLEYRKSGTVQAGDGLP